MSSYGTGTYGTAVYGASADTTAPSVPTGLSATAISSARVDLTWTTSTDDVAVTGYDVYRGGSLLATLGVVISYSDTSVLSSTTYSYTVDAFDAAGNHSAQSSSASATTPALSPPPLRTGWLRLSRTSDQDVVYSADQIYGFMLGSAAENYTFDWLGPDLQYRGDLTRYITPNSVPQLTHDGTQAVPRSMRFQCFALPAGLDPLSDMVRPHYRLRTPGGWVDWTLATLLLNPPDKTTSEDGTLYDFTASDIATLLVDDEFTDSYSVPGGATYMDAIRGLLGSVGAPALTFLGSLADKSLPDSRSWDAEKTKLSAINDLLDSIACRWLWFDEMGQPRTSRIPDYNLELPSWTWDATAGQSPVVSAPFRETPNPAGIVNYCRVIGEDSRNGKPAISATYENNRPDSPVSTSRYRGGRRKVKIIRDSSIADQESAYVKARAAVQEGARVYGPIQLWTLAWPAWQPFDIIHYVYRNPDQGIVDNNYLVLGWQMDLIPGGLTAHTLQRILQA